MSNAAEPTNVGKRLRCAREQSGLTQGQVAKLLGLHRPSISEIEAGRRKVRPDEIAKLAEAYGVDEGWIVSGRRTPDGEEADPRIEIAARELAKLKPDDLDQLLGLLKSLRNEQESDGE